MDTISELVGATRKAAVLGKRLREWRESLGTGTPDEAKDDIKKIKRYQRQLCTTMVTLGVETSDEETDFDITDVESDDASREPVARAPRRAARGKKKQEKLEEAISTILNALEEVDITFRNAMFLVSQATFPGQPQSEIAALYRLHYIWPTASDERVEREIQILSPSTQTPDAFSAELDAALQVADEVQKAVALREIIYKTSQSTAIGRWSETVIGGMLHITYAKSYYHKHLDKRFLAQIINSAFKKVHASDLWAWRSRTDGKRLETKARKQFKKAEMALNKQQINYLRLYEKFGASVLIQDILVPATGGVITKRSTLYADLMARFYQKIDREMNKGYADQWRDRAGLDQNDSLVRVLQDWRRTSHDSARALILQILRICLGNEAFVWADKWFADNGPSFKVFNSDFLDEDSD